MDDRKLYVRNSEDGTKVRALTDAQASRCSETTPNNFTDSAGLITGTIFSDVAPDGQCYNATFDRWFDASNIPVGMTASDFLAMQPGAGEPVAEADQWWNEPQAAAPVSGSSTSSDVATQETEQPVHADDVDHDDSSDDTDHEIHVEEGEPSPIGKTGVVVLPDGTATKVVVAPHGPIARLLELEQELAHEAATTAHRLLVEIHGLVGELRAHLEHP